MIVEFDNYLYINKFDDNCLISTKVDSSLGIIKIIVEDRRKLTFLARLWRWLKGVDSISNVSKEISKIMKVDGLTSQLLKCQRTASEIFNLADNFESIQKKVTNFNNTKFFFQTKAVDIYTQKIKEVGIVVENEKAKKLEEEAKRLEDEKAKRLEDEAKRLEDETKRLAAAAEEEEEAKMLEEEAETKSEEDKKTRDHSARVQETVICCVLVGVLVCAAYSYVFPSAGVCDVAGSSGCGEASTAGVTGTARVGTTIALQKINQIIAAEGQLDCRFFQSCFPSDFPKVKIEHRQIMQLIHPDKMGSEFRKKATLASQIYNQAFHSFQKFIRNLA